MVYFEKIKGKDCFLSPTTTSDNKNWSKWLNISLEEADKKIEQIQNSMEKYFSIVDVNKRDSIGIVSFNDINQLYQNCTISITNPDEINYSNGIIYEAINLALDYAFNCLNMHSVSLWIPENQTSQIKCFKQSGFQESARRRESIRMGDLLIDNIHLDILSTEYRSVYINRYLEEMNQYTVNDSEN